jgi:hypothetical protein
MKASADRIKHFYPSSEQLEIQGVPRFYSVLNNDTASCKTPQKNKTPHNNQQLYLKKACAQ